jgi:hypothetical protein
MLKETAEVICVPLQKIFENSMNTGIVPDDWREANVTPIFKKGAHHKCENYRPVSLTSQVSKLFETILRDKIVKHLEEHHLISDSQHGFREGRSCLTNLLTFFEEVSSGVDEKYPVDTIYLDFSKAFDKVPHIRLVKKLEAHGISGKVSNWIENWLAGRKQRVVLSGSSSGWLPVTSGVPQGSVLGPVMFIIYINDLGDNISGKVLKFADDTKLIRKIGNQEDINNMQEDLNKLCKWSEDWQMLFNVSKCKCLHFGYNNTRHQYQLGNEYIESVAEEKDLGVIVHESLSVSHQVAKAVKTANKVVGTIRRTITNKSMYNIVRLYKTLVRPHLEYCIQAWRPYLQKDIVKLENVQRRALKMITGFNALTYEERLRRTNLLTLEKRRVRADLIEVFKIISELEKIPSSNFFTLRTDSHNRRGHSKTLFKRHVRLNSRKFSFSQRVVNEWNSLPEKAVQSTTINQFKSQIDPIMRSSGGHYISPRLAAPVTRATED